MRSPLREAIRDVLRDGAAHQQVPAGAPVPMPWNPDFPLAQYMAQETETERADRLAAAVLRVVAERLHTEIAALTYYGPHTAGGGELLLSRPDVLALVDALAVRP